MRKVFSTIIVILGIGICWLGCDKLMGGGQQEVAPAAPAAIPVPEAPVTAPSQPASIPAATQPVAAAQPVAAPAVAPVAAAPVATAQPVAVAPAAPPTATGDALTDKLNTKKYELATDFTATSALLKQEIDKKAPQSYQVQLPGPPYCHTFIAVADDKVKNVDLSLSGPTGMKEASDDKEESTAVIANHCPTAPGVYTLMASVPTGKAEIAIQAFSK